MSGFYLWAMNYSLYLSKCVEIPICFVPSEFLRYRLLNPMMLATQGSIGININKLIIHLILIMHIIYLIFRWCLFSFTLWLGN